MLYFYFMTVLGNLHDILIFVLGFCIFISLLLLILLKDNDGGRQKIEDEAILKVKGILEKILYTLIITFFLLIFTPTKQDSYLLIAQKYLNTNELPAKVQQTIIKKLDSYLND